MPMSTRSLWFLLAALAALSVRPAVADPDPERKKFLEEKLRVECAVCHGAGLKGLIGPPLEKEYLTGKTDEDLAERILRGVPGTQMPEWGNMGFGKEDAEYIVKLLRAGWKG